MNYEIIRFYGESTVGTAQLSVKFPEIKESFAIFAQNGVPTMQGLISFEGVEYNKSAFHLTKKEGDDVTETDVNVLFSLFESAYDTQLPIRSLEILRALTSRLCNLMVENFAPKLKFNIHSTDFELARKLTAIEFTEDALIYKMEASLEGMETPKNAEIKIDKTEGAVQIYYAGEFLLKMISFFQEKGLFNVELRRPEATVEGFDFFVGNLIYVKSELANKYYPDDNVFISCTSDTNADLQNEVNLLMKYTCDLKAEKDKNTLLTVNMQIHNRLGLVMTQEYEVTISSGFVLQSWNTNEVSLTAGQSKVIEVVLNDIVQKLNIGAKTSKLPSPLISNALFEFTKEHLLIFGDAPKNDPNLFE
eukprot:TRINITY_DN11590_c0_g1_i1.p1 TRINITY_DN11590_c0_g1~~TRINITY_DN11590_c0_g1_i1.p1  ORF type:complete len:362 (-),score=111.61 TRINITY_DN11590_c0_g1_i1:55-1140(-)